MNRSQYKTTIYDINNDAYKTTYEFSNLEPTEYKAFIESMIQEGRFGPYANSCSVCRLSVNELVRVDSPLKMVASL